LSPRSARPALTRRADATGDLWAVGSYFDGTTTLTLILRWTGTAWTQVPSPSPGSPSFLQSVKPLSATNAWAVGTYSSGGVFKTLTEHWNGAAWLQVTSPNPGPVNELTSVAGTSASNLWAVGIISTPTADQTLILRWDGAAWAQGPTPRNGPGQSSDLSSVTATSAGNAWAVGRFGPPADELSLALHWDGTAWAVVPTPVLSSTLTELLAVGGSSASNIWAVGDYTDNTTSAQLPLAVHCC
jgi:hypothetical protein